MTIQHEPRADPRINSELYDKTSSFFKFLGLAAGILSPCDPRPKIDSRCGGPSPAPALVGHSPTMTSPHRPTPAPPSMDPITAERAAAILEGCRQALKATSAEPLDVLQYRDDLVDRYGSDVDQEILREQKELEHRFYDLCQRRMDLRGLPNKKGYITVQAEVYHVSKRMKEGIRVLCRRLREEDNVASNLVKIDSEVGDIISLLSCAVRELHQRQEFSKLRSVVDEMHLSRERCREVKSRSVIVDVRKLKEMIQLERGGYEEKVRLLQSETNALTEELLAIRTGMHKASLKNCAQKRAGRDSTLRSFIQDEAELKEDIFQLETQIQTERKAHKKVVRFVSQEHQNLENELRYCRAKYEDSLQKKEMKLAIINDERDDNLGFLVDFERRWDHDLVVEQEEEGERQRKVLRELEKEKEAERSHFAALIIQKRYKSYRRRKAKAKAVKGKKKDGKKGKKKGKKK